MEAFGANASRNVYIRQLRFICRTVKLRSPCETRRDRMKTPAGLQPLIDDGEIDAVLRPLKSGKEASVYVVQRGNEILCAKVYKDMGQRSFQARVTYEEGRKQRGSRNSRAVGKASKFGKREQEARGRLEPFAPYLRELASDRMMTLYEIVSFP